MPVVTSLAEIRANLDQLEAYLHSNDSGEREFARELVRNGRCFVVIGEGEGRLFGPSRFVGYANNTMVAHATNDDKDGKETNPAISEILQSGPEDRADLEVGYRAFCQRLGIVVREYTTVTRKYWPPL
jgi:hypothetical protein